jgi:Peptidase M30
MESTRRSILILTLLFLAAPILASPPTPTVEPYCTGPFCAATDAHTYSGTGTGIWRFTNSSGSPTAIDVSVSGLKSGQAALFVFSNGQITDTSAPIVPNPSPLPSPRPSFSPADSLQSSVDDAHHSILLANHERSIALIAARKEIVPNPLLRFAVIAPPQLRDPPEKNVAHRAWVDNFAPGSPKTYDTVARESCKLVDFRNAVFWVDPNLTGFDDAAVKAFTQAFCTPTGGYAQLAQLIGSPWGINTGANGDSLISDYPQLLDVNIAILNVAAGTNWGGYFSSDNNFTHKESPTSNESLVFFINGPGAISNQKYYLSTLLHELTHMINFYERTVSRGFSHDVWLEETSAMMTEDIVVPAVLASYSIIPNERVQPYARSGGNTNLLDWPQLSGPNYNMGGSLAAFLDRRYGIELYRGLIDCKAPPPTTQPSYGCVDGLIKAQQGQGFDDEFGRFAVSIFAALPAAGTPDKFGYPTLQSGGYTLEAIDVSQLTSLPQYPRPIGSKFSATSHTFVNLKSHAGSVVQKGVTVPPHSTLLLVVR